MFHQFPGRVTLSTNIFRSYGSQKDLQSGLNTIAGFSAVHNRELALYSIAYTVIIFTLVLGSKAKPNFGVLAFSESKLKIGKFKLGLIGMRV